MQGKFEFLVFCHFARPRFQKLAHQEGELYDVFYVHHSDSQMRNFTLYSRQECAEKGIGALCSLPLSIKLLESWPSSREFLTQWEVWPNFNL